MRVPGPIFSTSQRPIPDGTIVSFILYARDGTFRVLKMVDDDHSEFGSFCVLDAAVRTIAHGQGYRAGETGDK